MSERIRKESPLAEFSVAARSTSRPEKAGVHLRERPFLGHLNLRGDPTDQDFLRAAAAALGGSLPLEPNTVKESGELTVMWLGPDEWLLVTPPGREAETAEALHDSLGEIVASVTDVSGGQTVINISGGHARDALAKGCTLDLHPRVFGPGRCAQSLIAKAAVVIRQVDDSPSFDVIVRRSFADYLALWIEDATQEYGLSVTAGPVEG